MKLTKSSLKEMIREVIKEEKQLNEKVYNIDLSKSPTVIFGELYEGLFEFQKKMKKTLGPKRKKELDKLVKEMNYLRGKLMMNINEDFGTPIDSDVVKNPMDYASDRRDDGGSVKMFYNSYSSSEAKKVVEGRLKEYVQQLRKLEGKLIKDWMQGAKSGAIDFFDLMRGFNVGDVRRGHKYEIDFLSGLLERDKIQDRFRSYFKGKKGKPRR